MVYGAPKSGQRELRTRKRCAHREPHGPVSIHWYHLESATNAGVVLSVPAQCIQIYIAGTWQLSGTLAEVPCFITVRSRTPS